MASYSTNLLLSLLANGESGVHGFADWGAATNSNIQFLEDTVTETSNITVNTGDVTLSAAEERSLYLNLSGTLTGNRSVLTNDRKGMWLVYNGCTLSGNTLTFKTTSGTGSTMIAGEYALFVCDGTNAIKILSSAFPDDTFRVSDNSDPTKLLAFEVSGITTATTRTVTWPDTNVTIQSVGSSDSPQFTGIELGHASDTTLTRSAAGVMAVEGNDVLMASVADTLGAGFRDTLDDDGTQSSGTYTPSDSAGTWSKKIVNGGAFTLAPPSPSNDEVIYGTILMVNNASAGAVTVSGWTNTGGDSLTTTDTHAFIGTFCVFDDGGTEYSYLTWAALQ